MGRPMRRYSPKMDLSSRKEAASGRSRGWRASMYRAHSAAENTWEITVAVATPATPPCKASTNTRSSPTFNRQQRMRKYRGVRESPMARSTAETPLYAVRPMQSPPVICT